MFVIDDSTFLTETSLIITNDNPNPIISASLTLKFSSLSSLVGKFVGFRLVSSSGGSNFKYSINSKLFDVSTSIAVSNIGASTTNTVLWSLSGLTDILLIGLSPIQISIEYVPSSLEVPQTLTFDIEVYTHGLLGLTDTELLETISSATASVPLTINVVKGDVSTQITSYDPVNLGVERSSFNLGENHAIVIKTAINKDALSKFLTNLELSITIPKAAVDYSAGDIYISKTDNITNIDAFGNSIPSIDYYSTNLAASSSGITLTSDELNNIVTVNLSSLPTTPTDEKSKFIDGAVGVVSPLYVFITGTTK